MTFNRARKVNGICGKLSLSGGKYGLDELRGLYPDSRFYWVEGRGLMAFWNPLSGREPPRAISHLANFIEVLPNGPILKDRVCGGGTDVGRSMIRSMVEDIDVLEVMLS